MMIPLHPIMMLLAMLGLTTANKIESPCNAGISIPWNDGYQCICPPNKQGKNCSEDVPDAGNCTWPGNENACSSAPCHGEDAVCINTFGGNYKCLCPSGTNGDRCGEGTYCFPCASKRWRNVTCPVFNDKPFLTSMSVQDVTLKTQISRTKCTMADNWSFDYRTGFMWLAKGCRGEFCVHYQAAVPDITTGPSTTAGPGVERIRLFTEGILDITVLPSGKVGVTRKDGQSSRIYDDDFNSYIDLNESFSRVSNLGKVLFFLNSTSSAVLYDTDRKTLVTQFIGVQEFAVLDAKYLQGELVRQMEFMALIDAATGGLYQFSLKNDGNRTLVHTFTSPNYLATMGNLTIVSDRSDNLVIAFEMSMIEAGGHETFRYGGSTDKLLDVCIDSSYGVFIADYSNNRIVRLNFIGELQGFIPVQGKPVAVTVKSPGVLLVGDDEGYIYTIPYQRDAS
ncbi:unnamed protein product [Owenia fusiformis]|uniref:EGF-like domain-containing protein n=1 Tax=Owenia fusiformis TaxID=6347 RepID=A0A8S4PHU4_OWEFU|nr:unnamed protein product [Owenia fusiformis]